MSALNVLTVANFSFSTQLIIPNYYITEHYTCQSIEKKVLKKITNWPDSIGKLGCVGWPALLEVFSLLLQEHFVKLMKTFLFLSTLRKTLK